MTLPIIDIESAPSAFDDLRKQCGLSELLWDSTDALSVVREVVAGVRCGGDRAVAAFTRRFDGVDVTAATLRVEVSEVHAAEHAADPGFLGVLDTAITNIRRFQEAMLADEPAVIAIPGTGARLGVKLTPLARVGLYVPGGAAVYPGSVLHTAIPAQVAGVREICLCSPMRGGRVAPGVLAAASRLGINEVYGIGGAQAIAAMAFGTESIRTVDKVVGPGNLYVQLAKRELYGIVDIDSFAGPSEVVVLADETAAPAQVAAELLSQAEHGPGSSILVTTSRALAEAVQSEAERQLRGLSRESVTRQSLGRRSALIIAPTHARAIELVDLLAPEHLQITTREARADASRVSNAGAIFIGPYTPVAAGDYLAGPSHVLPTSGTSRFFSGLSADSFRKRTSVVEFDSDALKALAPDIIRFAQHEGFDAHAASVRHRLD